MAKGMERTVILFPPFLKTLRGMQGMLGVQKKVDKVVFLLSVYEQL